jgi:hypothetical protein
MVVFQVEHTSQPVPIPDAYGIRGRLTDRRNLAVHDLRSNIGDAIQQAEKAEDDVADAVVQVSAAQRGPLLMALADEKADRGLSPELTELEKLVLS